MNDCYYICKKFFLLGFIFTSSYFKESTNSCSMEIKDKFESLFWAIVEQRYVLINFSLLKLLSTPAVDTGSVKDTFRRTIYLEMLYLNQC